MTTLSPGERLIGLAAVWSEVQYNYPMWHRHPDLDWDAAFRERVPQALAEQSDWDYYRLLQAFAALVKDSHVNVWMPQHLRETRCTPPVALFPLQGRFVVTAFAAEVGTTAGLALGDEVVRVDGVPTAEYAAEYVAPSQSSPTPHDLALRVSWFLLEGLRDSTVEVGLRRPNGDEYVCYLTRTPVEGDAEWVRYTPLVGGRGVMGRQVAPGIGLITLKSFGYPQVVEEFDRALGEFGELNGLILDVRMNGGGNSGWSDQIIGRLITQPLPGMRERRLLYSPALRSWKRGHNGTGIVWQDAQNSPIEPQGAVSFPGPLVLLTSAATGSAAEDFVGPLKVSGRAKTVGETTGGSTGNPLAFDLPGGGGLIVCTRYMLLPDESEFIGIGIPPDIEVCPTPEDIACGRDPVLERAIAELANHSSEQQTQGVF